LLLLLLRFRKLIRLLSLDVIGRRGLPAAAPPEDARATGGMAGVFP